MNRRILSALAALAAIAAALLLYLNSGSSPQATPAAESASTSPETRPTAEPSGEAAPAVAAEAASEPAPQEPPSDEVLATRAMYAAHASLRSAEVDDPDSATNQRVKQEMIAKALARSAAKTGQP